MTFTKADDIKLVIPRAALESVFDECDRYDKDETGGRMLGTYDTSRDTLTVTVTGVIEPGPNTERSAVYLMQDGAYQEQVFREVEKREPLVEHLGNWHTHHMNGLRHLSGGDLDTYRLTVEHSKHNTDFFYALLVTEKERGKTGLDRYVYKNYLFRRGDPKVYEIPSSAVTLTDSALVWPMPKKASGRAHVAPVSDEQPARMNKAYDGDAVSRFFPKMKAFQSSDLGIYWRGSLALIDGSDLEVVVIENEAEADAQDFSVTIRNPADTLASAAKIIGEETFPSCREALIRTERICNVELYKTKGKRGKRWMF